MKYILFAAAMVAAVVDVHAQERAASGPMNTQMSWTALKNLTDTAMGRANTAHIRLNQTEVCANKGLLYAPSKAGVDSDGCTSAAGEASITTNLTQIQNCGRQNLVYNPATNACGGATAPTTVIVNAQQQATGQANANCPSGHTVVGGGGGCSGGYMHSFTSKPLNKTTWQFSCDTIGSTVAEAYAVCAKF